jgi:tetratricopeptide (TPR) repeat protein
MASAGLERLYNLQAKDGSFSWWGHGRSNICMTSYAFLAMAVSKKHGVPVKEKSYAAAKESLVKLERQARTGVDLKAFALYALSMGDEAPSEDLLRLYSRRSELDLAGKAALSLALGASGRPSMARDLANDLTSSVDGEVRPSGSFTRSVQEARSYVLLAMIRAGRGGPVVETGVRKLLDARRGRGWSSTRATGAAVSALCAYLEMSRFSDKGSVTVLLNGKELGTFNTGGGRGVSAQWIEIKGSPLEDGENRLEFVPEEGKPFLFSGRFGFRTGKPVKTGSELLRLDKSVTVLPPSSGGMGESIAADPEDVGNGEANRIVARPGDRIRVRLHIRPTEALSYVVVEDPIPGGAEWIGLSTGVRPDACEDRITHAAFFLTDVPTEGVTVEYILRAVHRGEYTSLPPRAEPMYRPSGFAQGSPLVLMITDDEGVMVAPDIVFDRAERAFHESRLEEALPLYDHLLENFVLKDSGLGRIHERILDIALARGLASRVAASFGALAERGAVRDVPMERLIAIASALRSGGEGEIALSLFRRGADEIVRDLSATASMLGRSGSTGVQSILGVPSFSYLLPDGPGLAEASLERAKLLSQSKDEGEKLLGARDYFAFTMEHPGSVHKERAWAAGLGTLLEVKAWKLLAREALRHTRLFPGGERVDEALYYRGYALFAMGDTGAALAQATKILEGTYRRPGRDEAGPSRFRHNAEHLSAQVYEVRGELAKAVEFYGKAADFIPDASRALAELTDSLLRAGGIVSVAPGATPAIDVEYRNTSSVSVKAYPVDLGLYFAIYKGFRNADKMRLAGVEAASSFDWKPERGDDHRRHTAKLELPGLSEGAYMIILRAGRTRTSALVVVSDLTVSARRFGQKVRVEVRDGKGEPVWGARVQIGSYGEIVGGGYTDPRGVIELELDPDLPLMELSPDTESGYRVLASKGNRYAMTKGER